MNLKHTTAQRLIEVFMIVSILAPAPSANKRKNMARAAESEIHGEGLKGEESSLKMDQPICSQGQVRLLRFTVYEITRLFSTESS